MVQRMGQRGTGVFGGFGWPGEKCTLAWSHLAASTNQSSMNMIWKPSSQTSDPDFGIGRLAANSLCRFIPIVTASLNLDRSVPPFAPQLSALNLQPIYETHQN
jgi:hypothetical protein